MAVTTYPSLVYGSRYPAIPHLFGSAFGDGDVVLSERQTRRVLARPVRAVEKLDGLNVGISFVKGVPRVHSRVRGELPLHRLGPGLWRLTDFVLERLGPLWRLLGNRFVVYGEWLEGAPSLLPYPRRDVPFVAFDVMDRERRGFVAPNRSRRLLADAGLAVPQVVFEGVAGDVAALWPLTRRSRFGGPSEGLVLTQGARCFKLVRHDFVARSVVARPQLPRARLPGRVAGPGVTKRFGTEEAALERVEVERLRRVGRLGPGLRRVEGRVVEMGRVPGRSLGARAPLADVAAVGRALEALHRVPTSLELGRLGERPSHELRAAVVRLRERGTESSRRWADVVEARLLPLIRALERGLPSAPVVCHGDLKPEHVKVHDGAARFLDLESALVADFAWELGAAFERLDLDGPRRVALAQAYPSEDGTRFLRAWLHRLVWWVVQPVALRGVPLSGSGARIVRQSEARARALLSALHGTSLPTLRAR